MFHDDEGAAELSRILAQINAKDAQADPPEKNKLEQRVEQLVQLGYGESAARAIATLESDTEVRNQITKDVASHMFGGGVKESRSATIIWPK